MPYVESPLDRIVDVHFGAPGPTSFSINWGTVWVPDGTGITLYEAGLNVMNVSVVGLPALRSPLQAGLLFLGTPPVPVIIPPDGRDDVSGEFPDGTAGTISAAYSLGRSFPGGYVSYTTTAQGGDRFGRVPSVSISLAITLVGVFRGTGYNWHATAQASGVSDQELSGFVASTLGHEGTLNFTATMTLDPPSLSFG
jgi:hypothetical protein